ncbi:MAG TPA: zinc transporter ZntB [Synergistaceae bacterium]|nr:zinc transporter ZntB [Synergistaceae bacterium]HPQ37136.1 zinc transporter ZntB [Synergistaceae bacterium]
MASPLVSLFLKGPEEASSEGEPLWIDLDGNNPEAQQWLLEESGLDPLYGSALLAEETRPRSLGLPSKKALLLTLRGINTNPGEDPEDMISLRIWAEKNRIITVHFEKVRALEDLRTSVSEGQSPSDTGSFLAHLCKTLNKRIGLLVTDLEEAGDDLEDRILMESSSLLRSEINQLRRQTIRMHRYLAPQREALLHLQKEELSWLSPLQRAQLREEGDRITRYVEDLDALRDHAAVTQDELESRLAERNSRILYMLSVVATLFLPLTFVTGLLGMNVGGIPWGTAPQGFFIVTALLLLLVVLLLWLFRRIRWL